MQDEKMADCKHAIHIPTMSICCPLHIASPLMPGGAPQAFAALCGIFASVDDSSFASPLSKWCADVHSRHRHLPKGCSQSFLLFPCPRSFCLPAHGLQVPSGILIVAVRIAVLPFAFLKHGSTSRILEFLGLLFGLFLVYAVFLPLCERFGSDGCKRASEFVTLGFEEVFDGQCGHRRVGHECFFGCALFLGLDDEAASC